MALEFKQEPKWTCNPADWGEYEIEFHADRNQPVYQANYWTGDSRKLEELGEWPSLAEATKACELHCQYVFAIQNLRENGLQGHEVAP